LARVTHWDAINVKAELTALQIAQNIVTNHWNSSVTLEPSMWGISMPISRPLGFTGVGGE